MNRVPRNAEPPPAGSSRNWLRQRLGRITSSGRYIAEVDGLRFVAITLVVLYHVETKIALAMPDLVPTDILSVLLHHLVSRGGYGVQLFFAISGFILSMPFAEHYLRQASIPSLKRYYIRRVTRLEPPYILNLLLVYLLLVFSKDESAGGLLPHLFASLTYVHNVAYHQASLINCVAWSLEVEVQFYLLAPLLSALYFRGSAVTRRALLSLFCIGCSASLPAILPAWCDLTLLGQLPYFMMGYLLADVYVSDDQEMARSWRWDAIAGLAAAGLVVATTLPPLPCRIALPWVTLLFYFGVFKGPVTNRLLRWTPLAVTGGMCYTIYLYHFQILGFLRHTTGNVQITNCYWINYAVQCLLLCPAVLLVCAALFFLLERPCMQRDWHIRLWEALRKRRHRGLEDAARPR